jgi:Ca-activated chloride channel family protein
LELKWKLSEGIDIVLQWKKYVGRRCCTQSVDKSKQVVSQIINQLGNDRIGIVAYAGNAFPVLQLPVITV